MRSDVKMTVWGDLALFTQGMHPVDRVTELLPTPSACRGILSSVYWHPQMDWRVTRVEVLKPIKTTSMVTNEIKPKATKGGSIYVEEVRTQRNNVLLKDVAYVIHANIRVRPGVPDSPQKYIAIFNRRVKRGQCFRRPFLGIRDYAAFFRETTSEDVPIDESHHFGKVLFDFNFDDKNPKTAPIPYYYDCKMLHGVVDIPQELYQVTQG